jgi:phosphoribosylformylglycinamidine cyclo-ligase
MPATYRRSGVDVEGADAWLSRMKPLIRSTRRSEVLSDRGQFAGLFRLSGAMRGMRDPVLVASTDGAGTKLKLAQLLEPAGANGSAAAPGAHEAIGVDVVAMNTNDVLAYGAAPLFFLDYMAVGALQPPLMSKLMRGIVRGCRESGCVLLGGETAEMPGVYGRGEYDVAGFCVGIAERKRLITGEAVRAGDVLVGLGSSGPHANGFSLVRKVFGPPQLRRWARALMQPTRIYVRPVLRALQRAEVHAIAHITGGGLARRLHSLTAKRPGLTARVIDGGWPVPPVFDAIQQAGRISWDEMRRTFNMGLGMVLAVPRRDSGRLVRLLRASGAPAWPVGLID